MERCFHCKNPITGNRISLETHNNDRFFCCNGCLNVYKLLSDEGFLSFYNKKGDIPLSIFPEDLPEKLEETYNEEHLKEFIYDENGLKRISLIIEGITCSACVWVIEKFAGKINGIKSFRISHTTHKGVVLWESGKVKLAEIIKQILKLGYKVHIYYPSIHAEKRKKYENDLLIRLGTAFFLMMNIMIISAGLYAGYFQGISKSYKNIFHYFLLLLSTPVVFYSGFPLILGAYNSLKQKSINMDLLVSFGVLSAYIFSIGVTLAGKGEVYFETASAIVFFVLTGKYIEARIKTGGGDFSEKLLRTSPREAVKLVNGKEERIPAFAVEIGDILKVKASETVPADGLIIEGSSHFDESFLTGESKPVKKGLNDEIYSGATSIDGSVLIKVTKKTKDMLISRILRLVEEAELFKAPVERFADRVSGYFTFSVIFIFMGVVIFWYFYSGSGEKALLNGISLLVISCPCALGLATPTAIHACIVEAASKGIIIKSGEIVEKLSKVNKVYFDKTGTITKGEIEILDIIPLGELSKDEIIQISASLEANSRHPISRAFKNCNVLQDIQDFREFSGKGVTGKISGKIYFLGNRIFISENCLNHSFTESDRHSSPESYLFLSDESKVIGIISIGDKIRKDSWQVIEKLKEMGLSTCILSGDTRNAVRKIAESLKIEEYRWEMLPEEKLTYLQNAGKKGDNILMVGDGINDAPSLKYADVGIAVSSAVDKAIEISDVILTKNNLHLLVDTLSISKRGFRTIKQNLVFASVYNIMAIPLAAAGLLVPVISAVAMILSSITVVANSARIRKFI